MSDFTVKSVHGYNLTCELQRENTPRGEVITGAALYHPDGRFVGYMNWKMFTPSINRGLKRMGYVLRQQAGPIRRSNNAIQESE